MKNENINQETDVQKIMRAKFRLGIWLLVFYIPVLLLAYRTYPFVGFTSTTQNFIYGTIATSAFWVSILIYIVITLRDILAMKKDDE